MSIQNRLLPFIGRTVAFFIIITVIWYFISPFYNQLLATVADVFHSANIEAENDERTIQISSETVQAGIYGLDLQYGLLIVTALIAATPGLHIIQRCKFISIAFGILFIVHIISIVVFARAANSGGNVDSDPLVILFSIVGADLFPVVVWGALSFRYFMSDNQTSPESPVSPTPGGKSMQKRAKRRV